jgi:hypothetical protein
VWSIVVHCAVFIGRPFNRNSSLSLLKVLPSEIWLKVNSFKRPKKGEARGF